MNSLVQLAEKKMLPDHQFMDTETVNWIERNDPFSEIKYLQNSLFDLSNTFKLLDKFRIDKNWFECQGKIDSIHGVRHMLRVAVNGLNLLKYGFNEEQYKNVILVAALCHDIKRENDKDDIDHGKRSAIWFRDNQKLITDKLVELNDKEIESVFYAIYYHNTDLVELRDLPEYKLHKREIDLLKIADGLDRYRLPKLKWWIIDELLPSTPPTCAKYLAYNLVLGSERNYIEGNNSYSSVLSIIEKYGTIKKT